MKKKSIKQRITLWYTLVLVIVLSIFLGGAFLASEQYSKTEMKEELIDEIGDLEEDISKYPDYFPSNDLLAYYDDGVMLGIYNSKGDLINGIIPDDFPIDHPFVKTDVQEVSNKTDKWYVYDKVFIWNDDEVYWIRGIHSYSEISHLVDMLTKWILILFPILISFTAFVGYLMISKSLRPVQEITDKVNEITHSADLSLRLQESESHDELSYLAETFNDMLANIEDQFIREKQFSSDAAHELRTPISVILSHCEYMLQDMELNKEEREEIEIMYEKSQYMSNLVDALLLISRTEKKNYKINLDEFDLSVLAESVVDDMEIEASRKNIHIRFVDQLEDASFVGDMTLIIRLFTNLISNSIKYGKENGNILVQLQEENGLITLLFEDNGIGIPKESLDKIWDRFYQVETSRANSQGFGLGLFMVRRIVQLHKGTIEVSSSFGEGRRFVITFPKLSKLES